MLNHRSPKTNIIILTDDNHTAEGFFYGFCGVSGYISKDTSPDLLHDSIRAVYHGGRLFIQGIAEVNKVISKVSAPCWTGKNIPESISQKERQIMGFICQGFSNKEIAGILALREGTIRNYVSSLLLKTGLHDRTQIAIYALKAGIVT
jgi:DNA-binding NarL/FixJ family response regulator